MQCKIYCKDCNMLLSHKFTFSLFAKYLNFWLHFYGPKRHASWSWSGIEVITISFSPQDNSSINIQWWDQKYQCKFRKRKYFINEFWWTKLASIDILTGLASIVLPPFIVEITSFHSFTFNLPMALSPNLDFLYRTLTLKESNQSLAIQLFLNL